MYKVRLKLKFISRQKVSEGANQGFEILRLLDQEVFHPVVGTLQFVLIYYTFPTFLGLQTTKASY